MRQGARETETTIMATKNDKNVTKSNPEDIFAENLEMLRAGYKLAKAAWKTEKPTIDQVLGVIGGLEEETYTKDMAEPLFASAIDQAGKIGLTEPEDILTVLDIMLVDEGAEEHLATAKKEAESLFGAGCTGETVIGVYFQIYSVDEDEDAE
jgi:hypothetical protein